MAPLKILWADDEIEMLKPHIIFLEQKGYEVSSVSNGEDAVESVRNEDYDLVLLDEMMPGKGGLAALTEIREFNPSVPIIMVTKNEEEMLMEEALGQKITDYLTKPVNPSQILMACKKIFDSRKIEQDRLTRDYSKEFLSISQAIEGNIVPEDWIETFLKLTEWELELDRFPELGFQGTVNELHRDANRSFGRYMENVYREWVNSENRPPMSVDIFPERVFPKVEQGRKAVFILIDCMRIDQWITIEPLLYDYFKISRDYYFSILPTATPYSRNAIFSGYFPGEIEQNVPDLWQKTEEDEHSSNRFEHQFLEALIKRTFRDRKLTTRYIKILDMKESQSTLKNISSLIQSDILCIVVNFVDILGHQRSESEILREIAPDEAAYRSLIKSWFEHSDLLSILRKLAGRDVTVFITTDHGSIRGKHPAKVIGDRETSTSLRYKFGRNLKCDPKHVFHIREPADYRLPLRGINTQYILAKEDYYLIYPNDFNRYAAMYKDCFHHGGISLDEVILPFITLEGLQK
ncbi:response regulator [candidate division KSB1 bacterium]